MMNHQVTFYFSGVDQETNFNQQGYEIFFIGCDFRLMDEKYLWDWYFHAYWDQECWEAQYFHGFSLVHHHLELRIA